MSKVCREAAGKQHGRVTISMNSYMKLVSGERTYD